MIQGTRTGPNHFDLEVTENGTTYSTQCAVLEAGPGERADVYMFFSSDDFHDFITKDFMLLKKLGNCVMQAQETGMTSFTEM